MLAEAHTASRIAQNLFAPGVLKVTAKASRLLVQPLCAMSNMPIRNTAFVAPGGCDRGLVRYENFDWLIRVVVKGTRLTGLASLQTWHRTNIGTLSTDLGAILSGRTQAIRTAARLGIRFAAKRQFY